MQVPCLQFTLITSRTEVRSQLIADDEKAMVLNRLRLTLSLYWFHKKQVVWLLVLFSAFLSGARRLHAIWRTNYQIGADLTNRILALVPGGTHAAAPLCNLKWILSKIQQIWNISLWYLCYLKRKIQNKVLHFKYNHDLQKSYRKWNKYSK